MQAVHRSWWPISAPLGRLNLAGLCPTIGEHPPSEALIGLAVAHIVGRGYEHLSCQDQIGQHENPAPSGSHRSIGGYSFV